MGWIGGASTEYGPGPKQERMFARQQPAAPHCTCTCTCTCAPTAHYPLHHCAASSVCLLGRRQTGHGSGRVLCPWTLCTSIDTNSLHWAPGTVLYITGFSLCSSSRLLRRTTTPPHTACGLSKRRPSGRSTAQPSLGGVDVMDGVWVVGGGCGTTSRSKATEAERYSRCAVLGVFLEPETTCSSGGITRQSVSCSAATTAPLHLPRYIRGGPAACAHRIGFLKLSLPVCNLIYHVSVPHLH